MGKELMGEAEKKTCYICGPKGKYVDDHHYDCSEGKLSPETVPLCRRCHRTYHDLGVEWFDDEYLDKAIEIENKRREILGHGPMRKEEVKRTDYYNKTHGLPETKERKGSQTPAFAFHLPRGEPLCGWQWVHEHLYDLLSWVPRIEIVHPDLNLAVDIDSAKKLRDTIKAIRGLKCQR